MLGRASADLLKDMQRCVGGHLEVAYMWSSGDTLYVDDEGMLKPKDGYFVLAERRDQVLHGNGLVVGPELGSSSSWTTANPTMTLLDLKQRVRFFDLLNGTVRRSRS